MAEVVAECVHQELQQTKEKDPAGRPFYECTSCPAGPFIITEYRKPNYGRATVWDPNKKAIDQ